MPVLALRLAGPLQSWGSESRFVRRATEPMPTKSGVLGLLAAAKGLRRTDPLEDLVGLRFGVRADQSGVRQVDFQTARHQRSGVSKPLSYREYLADAKFLAVLEGPSALLEGVADAVRSPAFPLYLGRRACPPGDRLLLGMRECTLEEALESEPWLAADWFRRRQPEQVSLAVSRDARPGEAADERLHDVPLSFNPRNRQYGWRDVRHEWLTIDNPLGRFTSRHDPLSLLGGA